MWKKIIIVAIIILLLAGCHTESQVESRIDRTSDAYQDVVMALVIKCRHPEWGTKEIMAEVEYQKYLREK